MNKQEIFTTYNEARTSLKVWMEKRNMCETEKREQTKRLNRAFGLLQSKNYQNPYQTTSKGCTCPDQKFQTHLICKHRLAARMQERIEIRREEIRRATPVVHVHKKGYAGLVLSAFVDYMGKQFMVLVKYVDQMRLEVFEETPIGSIPVRNQKVISLFQDKITEVNRGA